MTSGCSWIAGLVSEGVVEARRGFVDVVVAAMIALPFCLMCVSVGIVVGELDKMSLSFTCAM